MERVHAGTKAPRAHIRCRDVTHGGLTSTKHKPVMTQRKTRNEGLGSAQWLIPNLYFYGGHRTEALTEI